MESKLVPIWLILVVFSSSVSAVIIESTTSNQATYKNGDLITITIQANAYDLDVRGDFSSIDSNFNPNMVMVEPNDLIYEISYPITYSNTKQDETYNAVITAYDSITSTTSSVTYGIILENQGNKIEDVQELIVKVTEEATITIQEGYIQVCTSTRCDTLTKAEYDATRNYVISSGQVSLSNVTYNQLRDEIQAATNAQIREDLEAYITQIIEIKRIIENNMYDMQELYLYQQNLTQQYRNDTQKVLRKGARNNLLALLGVMIMMSAFIYMIYLRTETTWFTR